ncbi:golgin subfamily A member 2-like isoform X3 [Falco cherrug]|uniref:golgin subfamily A member 2-like isoform X3 n=1 Tax=Falco cherrug TaxID=345164 RepID=UPI00247A6627|nr:golgin subfamily A member 2-like isoform X3 [Falco cherrug]
MGSRHCKVAPAPPVTEGKAELPGPAGHGDGPGLQGGSAGWAGPGCCRRRWAKPRRRRRGAAVADGSGQSWLAAGKEKLKEYQQKKSPGAAAGSKENHKTKGDGRPETPLGDDQQPPENIQNILKVPVSELKRSNGVAIPSLDRRKKEQSQEAVDQLEKEKKELEKKFSEEQAALREQLQVCIQTIGILASEKPELQAALAHTREAAGKKSGEAESLAARLRSSHQRVVELERTLASVSLQQKQAEKRNEELMKERKDLKQELYKQSKSSEEMKVQNSELSQKIRCMVSEDSALQLYIKDLHEELDMAERRIHQVRIQTIGILASEKSDLQAALAHTREAAGKKSGEAESLAACLRSSLQRESELERTLASVSLQQKQAEKRNEELMKELEDLKQELYKQSKSSEEIKQKNSQLSQQFCCLVSKYSALQLYIKDWDQKLDMAERRIHQVRIQTIGILASEKSDLQAALAHTREAAGKKSGEAESLAACLRSSLQRESELERTLASVSLQQKQAEKRNEELMKELEDLKQELYKQSKSSEEIKQKNSQLSQQFCCLVSKYSALQLYIKDWDQKLDMAERRIQQVCIQTIGILASEKPELQAALAHTREAAGKKSGEAESLAARLRSSHQRVVELERTLASVSLQQKQAEKRNEELMKELEDLKQELYKQSKSSEEMKVQNSKLSRKFRCLVSQDSALQLYIKDMRKKLDMAERRIQQVRVQTIGIVTSEKSELQAALAHTREAAGKKSALRVSFQAPGRKRSVCRETEGGAENVAAVGAAVL